MNLSVIANAALAGGFFVLFALPALARRQKRWWVAAVFVVALLDSAMTLLPVIDHQLQFPGVHWNWAGKVFSIAAMLAVAAAMIAAWRLSARDIGLTFRQAPGTGRALLAVILPYLVVLVALALAMFGNSAPPSRETLAYQATMPGLAEELSYRGLQLAMFDRMFAGRIRLLGAEIGYCAFAVSIVFGLLHGVGFDGGFHLQVSALAIGVTGTIGFVLAWLRERTRSLALPVVLHNVTNLILEGVPKIF
ncbi:MAG TPA: CPBP family intramembrane glutamic endopeptidase [Rhizomicrobium sp.]|nr:CPBP family intramembrane glutamic endopeptidase [Rhizomicrobium sp.]